MPITADLTNDIADRTAELVPWKYVSMQRQLELSESGSDNWTDKDFRFEVRPEITALCKVHLL